MGTVQGFARIRSGRVWTSALRSVTITCKTLLLLLPATLASSPKPQLSVQEILADHNVPENRSSPVQLMAEVNIHQAHGVKVFVYDEPALDFSDLIHCFHEKYGESPWQAERADMAQDMGEIWLHRAMLEHPWRVLEADEADVFYIPIYPVLSYKLLKPDDHQCRGLTHEQRMENAVNYLQTRSVYFRRFGGGDHLLVCAWWNCRNVFNGWQRMVLRRVVLGINEAIKDWANWGCGGRSLTIPYTANSIITTPEYFGGAHFDSRTIPFFFVGNTRRRPERQNLKVARELYPESIIYLSEENDWGINATDYAGLITRSKFCFCPRGDTKTSRRIFDAVAAGCIPVLTSKEVTGMPFFRAGLNYSEFAIVASKGGFKSRENVTAVVESIASRSDEELKELLKGVQKAAVTSLVYGLNDGPDVEDMWPFPGVASRLLSEALRRGGGKHLWTCKSTNLNERVLSPRTKVDLPPSEEMRHQWLSESETIINTKRSLLFCAPPNAGSLQFRMLAKRMEGVEHWAVSDNRELLFDPVASGLSLLDVKNASLMNAIYRDNDGGWIKIGVVRDPITRLVSSYLDYVHALDSTRSHSDRGHRGLRNEDLEWFKGVSGRRRLRMRDLSRKGVESRNASETGGEDVSGRRKLPLKEVIGAQRFEYISANGSALEVEIVGPILPTFPDLLEALENSMPSAPPAFQTISSLCGMRHSPFDSVIPFETLQKTSTEVLKSLPGDIWDEYGASGWGPDGQNAFMEFDYGSVLRSDKVLANASGCTDGVADDDAGGEIPEESPSSVHARNLFKADSCDWMRFYPDEDTLDRVAALYSMDYITFGWYGLGPWIDRMHTCLGGN